MWTWRQQLVSLAALPAWGQILGHWTTPLADDGDDDDNNGGGCDDDDDDDDGDGDHDDGEEDDDGDDDDDDDDDDDGDDDDDYDYDDDDDDDDDDDSYYDYDDDYDDDDKNSFVKLMLMLFVKSEDETWRNYWQRPAQCWQTNPISFCQISSSQWCWWWQTLPIYFPVQMSSPHRGGEQIRWLL